MQTLDLIKQTARHLITSINHIHRPGNQRDILILSSTRSGSTWLMESFCTQPGVKYINVPFEKIYLEFLRIHPKPGNFYPRLTDDEKRIFKDYLTNDRPIRHCGPLNIFERDFNFLTKRRVLKIHKITPLIEWLADESDFEIIYLIRHPIPQSISAKRRRFSNRLKDFLSDEIFLEQRLSTEQRIIAETIFKHGTELEQYVTSWCLENLVALKIPKDQRRWTFISYEELVTKPRECFAFLGERLDFEHIERLLTRFNIPSKESHTAEKAKRIQMRDVAYLINGWVKEVDAAEVARSMDILRAFDIQAYLDGRLLPGSEYLRFPDMDLQVELEDMNPRATAI